MILFCIKHKGEFDSWCCTFDSSRFIFLLSLHNLFFVFDKGTSKLDILVLFCGPESILLSVEASSTHHRSMNFIHTSWSKLRELLNVARSNVRHIPKIRSNKNQNFTQIKQNIQNQNQTSSYQRMQVLVATWNISWPTAVSVFIFFCDRLLNSCLSTFPETLLLRKS